MFSKSFTAPRTWLVAIGWLCLFAGSTVGAEQAAPAAPKSAEQDYFERAIHKVESGLAGSAERLPLYLQLFERELINDPRLFPCHVGVEWTSAGHVVLTGCVGLKENRIALRRMFEYLRFDRIDDRVEVLPSNDLGEKRFGLIRAFHSFSFDSPAEPQEVLTDCLLGTPVFLLREAENGYFLCHAMEGYVGYVAGRDIRRMDCREFDAYQSGPQVRMLRNHTTDAGLVVPLSARLKLLDRESDRLVVALPDGVRASIPANSCHASEGAPDPRIERIIAAAERLLGTKYVWGGNTSDGIDCSGLVQTAFATEGITLARDSNQQVLAGRLVATRWHRDGLRRGDTLYFLGEHGKIRHTALYLGGGRYIEAVRPVVRYSSFDPSSAEYSERGDAAFCFGKRILE